jgi:hypothetical protein
LAFCGVGFGLLNAVLSRSALPDPYRVRRPATLEVGAKHLGIVVGLVAIAPMLAGDLEVATKDAAVAATAVVLDARLELRVKVPLALDLKRLVEKTPRGQVPDVGAALARRGAGEGGEIDQVRGQLTEAIKAPVTSSFRSSFAAAAWLAAGATVAGVVVATLSRTRRPGDR